eukprot:210-Heterococcus_DN1.PRE.1
MARTLNTAVLHHVTVAGMHDAQLLLDHAARELHTTSNRIRAARLWHITQMEPNVSGYSNVLSSSSGDAHNYRTSNTQCEQQVYCAASAALQYH